MSTKTKKILKITLITLFVILLIVFATLTGIVYSVNMDNDYSFVDNRYNKDYDGKTNPVTFNVATYNVKGGKTTKDNLDKINKQLAAYDIDIAGLQEVYTDDSSRCKENQTISTLTQAPYTNKYFAATESLAFRDEYGIMTTSKYELKEYDRFFLPMPGRFYMFSGEPRVCIRTVVNINGVDIAFYNTHLSYETNVNVNNEEMRISQLKFILNLMEEDRCQYQILVGDLNLIGFEELDCFKDEKLLGKYNFVNNENNKLESYRGNDCTFKCLDNIIYSENLKIVKSEMVSNELSDHNMIYCTFETMEYTTRDYKEE